MLQSHFRTALLALCLLAGGLSTAQAQYDPQSILGAQRGFGWEAGRSAAWELDQRRKLLAAVDAIKPHKKGVVDAFVLVVSLDADPVFAKEARETANVLERRYSAKGRTVVLAAGTDLAAGSPANLAAALAAMRAKMDVKEDALILYTTSHGGPDIGLVYRDAQNGYGMIAPQRLAQLFAELQIERRLVMISACYSGPFLNALATPSSIIVTAADDDRTSFGCAPGNDWTFFGDALINNALRKPIPFAAAAQEAFGLISGWEYGKGLTGSKPRIFIGEDAKAWLATLEKKIPADTTPKVGRPAIDDTPKPPLSGR